MHEVRLYWEFHKSTIAINWGFSLGISLLFTPLFPVILSISLMSAGAALALFYKEIMGKHEYYYYYNRGISKVWLITRSMLINILSAMLILNISYACT